MFTSSNKYTFILLKDHANLRQIKLSPLTVWSIVSIIILTLIVCIIAVIVASFIWMNSQAILLEKERLQKLYAIAEIRLNRLSALEGIIYKQKDIAILPSSSQNRVTNKQSGIQEEQNEVKKQSSINTESTKTKTSQPNKNSMLYIKNSKVSKEDGILSLSMEISTTSKQKQTGTIRYSVTLKNGNTYAILPVNTKQNCYYSIQRFKHITTTFILPENVIVGDITEITIELLDGTLLVQKQTIAL